MTEPDLLALAIRVRDETGRETTPADRERIAARIAHLSGPEQNTERAALKRLLYLAGALAPTFRGESAS